MPLKSSYLELVEDSESAFINMLVFAANPNGIVNINHFAIYGQYFGKKPVDLPYKLWKLFNGQLQNASYRRSYFKEKFGVEIPEIAFTVDELEHLPFYIVQQIGSALGVYNTNISRTLLETRIMWKLKRVT